MGPHCPVVIVAGFPFVLGGLSTRKPTGRCSCRPVRFDFLGIRAMFLRRKSRADFVASKPVSHYYVVPRGHDRGTAATHLGYVTRSVSPTKTSRFPIKRWTFEGSMCTC